MQIDLLTLFPDFFTSPLNQSIVKRAQEKHIITTRVINLRDYALDRHHVVDDRPFGGGPGMVMKVEPVAAAITALRQTAPDAYVILLSPQGRLFNQRMARALTQRAHIVLLCGHYEGLDDRVHYFIDDEVSVGDYILTGGEIPALIILDAVTRLLPGTLGDEASAQEDSFQDGLLEYPHYTRPRAFAGFEVPEILLSGDHSRIARWRRQEALRRTWERRPDLLEHADLTKDDEAFLATLQDTEITYASSDSEA